MGQGRGKGVLRVKTFHVTEEVEVRIDRVDGYISPGGDRRDDEIAQGQAPIRSSEPTAHTCGLEPIFPSDLQTADSLKQRGNILRLGLNAEALEDFGYDGADQRCIIVVEEGVHGTLLD